MKAELHAYVRKHLKKYFLMFLKEFSTKGSKRILHLYKRDALIPRSTPMNVLSFAQIEPNVLVLDVGCGDGLSLKFYQRHGARGIGLEITVVPEFPASIILPFFMIVTLIAAMIGKKRIHKQKREGLAELL